MDDNVHMQNSIQLVKRLQENKNILNSWSIPVVAITGVKPINAFYQRKQYVHFKNLLKKVPAAMLR
jgi:hypothetical protein